MDVLVAEVHSRTVLWNKKNPRYKDRVVVDREWDFVAEKIGIPKDDVKKKWRNMRDQFFKELKKIPRSKLNSCRDCTLVYPGKWQYFNSLVFLKDTVIPPGSTEENTAAVSPPRHQNSAAVAKTEESSEDDVKPLEEAYRPAMLFAEAPHMPADASTTRQSSAFRRTASAALKRKRLYEKRTMDRRLLRKKLAMSEAREDENSLFLRSLLPFFEQMTPLQQLRTRNKFQDVLIEELQGASGFATHVKHEAADQMNA